MKIFVLLLCFTSILSAQEKHPKIFAEKGKLIYSDDFDGEFNKDFWEIRQSGKWIVKDGKMTGTESPIEYQQKMIAKKDSHTGEWPIIRLNKIPAEFICHMRVKYGGKEYAKNRPLLDVGHHKNSFLFSAKSTRLLVDKTKFREMRQGCLLPLNQWLDITIELKNGKLAMGINGKTEVYENENISMHGHSEFTFKGISHGKLIFDSVKLWELKR
jgi:hypothetical protein